MWKHLHKNTLNYSGLETYLFLDKMFIKCTSCHFYMLDMRSRRYIRSLIATSVFRHSASQLYGFLAILSSRSANCYKQRTKYLHTFVPKYIWMFTDLYIKHRYNNIQDSSVRKLQFVIGAPPQEMPPHSNYFVCPSHRLHIQFWMTIQ